MVNLDQPNQIMAIEHLIQEGFALTWQRYGPCKAGEIVREEELPFHNLLHTKNVSRRAGDIVLALNGSDEDLLVARLAAAWHDVVMQSTVRHGIRSRQRGYYPDDNKPGLPPGTIGNELASANDLERRLRQVRNLEKNFSERLVQRTHLAISYTFPSLLFDHPIPTEGDHIRIPMKAKKGISVDQPHLQSDLRLHGSDIDVAALALALADLYGTGLDRYIPLQEGQHEWMELNPGYTLCPKNLSAEMRKQATKSFLDWMDLQEAFQRFQWWRYQNVIKEKLNLRQQEGLDRCFQDETFAHNLRTIIGVAHKLRSQYHYLTVTGEDANGFLELIKSIRGV